MAKKKRKKLTRYRDSLTGAFVSKATYKRSKAHGGTRYVRSKVPPKGKARKQPRRQVGRPPVKVSTVRLSALWFVTLKYVNNRGARTFDFFVKSRKKENVMKYIARFAAGHKNLAFSDQDPRAKDVISYLDGFGWSEKRIALIPKGEFPEYDNKPEGFVTYQ